MSCLHAITFSWFQPLCCSCEEEEEEEGQPPLYNDLSDQEGWNILSYIFDSSNDVSSDDDNDEQENEIPIHFDVESDEDSVDDKNYYVQYTPNGHPLEESNLAATKSFLNSARIKYNTCREAMRQLDFDEILNTYDLALRRCPLRYKRKLIKEYELLIDFYPLSLDDMNEAHRLHDQALSINEGGFEQQRRYFINAIILMPDLKIKNEWKREYNAFIKT